MKLPSITRPNGSTYRPRVLASVVLGDEDETTGIVVFGTHDVATALSVARLDVRAMNRDIGFRDHEERYAVREDTARTVWWTQKLSHFEEFGHASYWYQTDDEKGRAGVLFDVALSEPEPSDPSPDTPT